VNDPVLGVAEIEQLDAVFGRALSEIDDIGVFVLAFSARVGQRRDRVVGGAEGEAGAANA
jgi:hypothetical protein